MASPIVYKPENGDGFVYPKVMEGHKAVFSAKVLAKLAGTYDANGRVNHGKTDMAARKVLTALHVLGMATRVLAVDGQVGTTMYGRYVYYLTEAGRKTIAIAHKSAPHTMVTLCGGETGAAGTGA